MNKAPNHIGPSHANWDLDAELDLWTFGERAAYSLDSEACGWSALDNLSYILWTERNDPSN